MKVGNSTVQVSKASWDLSEQITLIETLPSKNLDARNQFPQAWLFTEKRKKSTISENKDFAMSKTHCKAKFEKYNYLLIEVSSLQIVQCVWPKSHHYRLFSSIWHQR